MSEKIQITQEESDILEKVHNKRESYLRVFINDEGFHGFNKELMNTANGFNNELMNRFSVHQLARLLYEPDSYEVVPEFKIGDWVVHLPSGIIAKVSKVIDNGNVYIDADGINTLPEFFRYATPEEIEQEKERRFWHENGREVWELLEGDIININGEIEEIEEIDNVISDLFIRTTSDHITLSQLKNLGDDFKVVCFGGNREDMWGGVIKWKKTTITQ